MFEFAGDAPLFVGDLLLLEVDDSARETPGMFPDDVLKGPLLGVLVLVRDPLLINVDPGRFPNLGKAK